MDWINLVHNMDQCMDLVNTIMNLRVWNVLEQLHNWRYVIKAQLRELVS
jgi:hypothetical protein